MSLSYEKISVMASICTLTIVCAPICLPIAIIATILDNCKIDFPEWPSRDIETTYRSHKPNIVQPPEYSAVVIQPRNSASVVEPVLTSGIQYELYHPQPIEPQPHEVYLQPYNSGVYRCTPY